MICQTCLKNAATVHVTELDHTQAGPGQAPQVQERHLCEVCAQSLHLPSAPPLKKTVADIWKLLQLSAQHQKKQPGPACPECGMTLEEFRKQGRLGCAKDYEVFAGPIRELLERVHGARTHVGRVPGTTEAETERLRRVTELKQALDAAVREEAYEKAAGLRDELKTLEEPARGGP